MSVVRDYYCADGVEVEVCPVLPSVSVVMSDGTEYWFQEHEADELLKRYKQSHANGVGIAEAIWAETINW